MPDENKPTVAAPPQTDPPPQTGEMYVADVMLNLSKDGFHAHLTGVTPAELLLLLAEHSANSGGKCLGESDPIASGMLKPGMNVTVESTEDQESVENGKKVTRKITVLKDKRVLTVTRSEREEVQRLRGKYAGNKINTLYPGASPSLPKTFKEAMAIGPQTSLPTSKLTEVKLL